MARNTKQLQLQNVNNIQYWKDRKALRVKEHWQKAENVQSRLIREYNSARVDIMSEIEKLYGKYAGKTGMSYSKAVEYLNGKEVDALRDQIGRLKKEWIATGNTATYQKYSALATRQRITRLEALQMNIDYRLSILGKNQTDIMEKSLKGLYKDNYYKSIYEVHKGTGYTTSFAKIDENQLTKIIQAPMPVTGSGMLESIRGNIDNLSRTIRQELIKGTMQGSSIDTMAKSISTKTGTAKANALRLVRTETAHIIGESDKESYEELGLERYQFVATLDELTGDLDASLDGQNFLVSEAVEGFNYPPIHPNCRCDTIPYIDGAYSERIAKDIKTGKSIAINANISYDEWEKLVA